MLPEVDGIPEETFSLSATANCATWDTLKEPLTVVRDVVLNISKL